MSNSAQANRDMKRDQKGYSILDKTYPFQTSRTPLRLPPLGTNEDLSIFSIALETLSKVCRAQNLSFTNPTGNSKKHL